MNRDNIDIHEVKELRLKTLVYFGCGAIKKISDIAQQLKKRNLNKILVVTGHGAYKAAGAWDYVLKAFAENDLKYVLYDKVTPNPTTIQIDEAVKCAPDASGRRHG